MNKAVKSEKILFKIAKIIYYISNPKLLINVLTAKIYPITPILKYKPFSLTLWITDRCNLKCSYCLKNLSELSYRHAILPDMTYEVFRKIMAMFDHVEYVAFIGQGEPLLNNDVFRMFEYLMRRKKKVNLVTNGTTIDNDVAVRLMQYNLEIIHISLKATSVLDYKKIAGCSEECYERIISGIGRLVKYKKILHKDTKIAIQYVLGRNNLFDMPKVIELAESLGVDKVVFLNYIPFGAFNEEGTKQSLFFEDDDARGFIGEIKTRPHKLIIDGPILLLKNGHKGLCPSSFTNLCIDSAGNVGICDRVIPPAEKYGNVFRDRNIWNSECFIEARKNYLSGEDKLPPRCKYCVEMSRGL